MDKVYTVTYEPPTDKKPAQLRAKHQGKEYVLPFQMEMWGKLDGTKKWFLNDVRHRENEPAVERLDGFKAWYLNDLLH